MLTLTHKGARHGGIRQKNILRSNSRCPDDHDHIWVVERLVRADALDLEDVEW